MSRIDEIALTRGIVARMPKVLLHEHLDGGLRPATILCVNTDNRLMSDTTLTKELWTMVQTWGLTSDDLEKLSINAIKSAFIPYKRRCAIIYNTIKPGFARLRTELED